MNKKKRGEMQILALDNNSEQKNYNDFSINQTTLRI